MEFYLLLFMWSDFGSVPAPVSDSPHFFMRSLDKEGRGGGEGKTEEKEREWYCLCIAEDVTFSIDSRFSD